MVLIIHCGEIVHAVGCLFVPVRFAGGTDQERDRHMY